ncbi:MAG TPA: ATP-binding protein, partial [Perlabentimonas sp.]|nr:ATP-binding protein [Perlabentimonas sp.]
TNSIPESNKEIIDAFRDYFDAYTSRDWDRMTSRFSKNMTMFGTGIDEAGNNAAETISFFKREFSQSPESIKYTINSISTHKISETTAYLTVLMDMFISMGQEVINCHNNRSTIIMVKEDGIWKLAHGHWSQPAEGQEVGGSIPYKLLKEQNKLLEEKVTKRTREVENQNIKLKNLNDTKTKLFSIIAHDMRSPFNAFMGLTEVMLLNFEENISNPEYFKIRLEQIHERATNLYSVADNLLNWAWAQTEDITINWADTQIERVIKKQVAATEDVAKHKNININLDIDPNLCIKSDSEILGIVIRNLILNAVKYSYRNSSIEIRSNTRANEVEISITDHGVGMDQELVNKICNTLAIVSLPGTENEKGTGLGMQMSKELIGKLHGAIRIQSTPNAGTTISIILPIT